MFVSFSFRHQYYHITFLLLDFLFSTTISAHIAPCWSWRLVCPHRSNDSHYRVIAARMDSVYVRRALRSSEKCAAKCSHLPRTLRSLLTRRSSLSVFHNIQRLAINMLAANGRISVEKCMQLPRSERAKGEGACQLVWHRRTCFGPACYSCVVVTNGLLAYKLHTGKPLWIRDN